MVDEKIRVGRLGAHVPRGWGSSAQLQGRDAEDIDVAVIYPSRGLVALTVPNLKPRSARYRLIGITTRKPGLVAKQARALLLYSLQLPLDRSARQRQARSRHQPPHSPLGHALHQAPLIGLTAQCQATDAYPATTPDNLRSLLWSLTVF